MGKAARKRGASLEKIRSNLSKVKNISIDYNPSPNSLPEQFHALSVTTPPTDSSEQSMDAEPTIFSPSHSNHHNAKAAKPPKPASYKRPPIKNNQQTQSGFLPKPKLHPTIKQQQDKNAHNASLYAVANNNPKVQNRLNALNQHQIQQQNKSNKINRHHSMSGVRQYSNGNKIELKNRTNVNNANYNHSLQPSAKLKTSNGHQSISKRHSFANTSSLQDIQRMRMAQKEEARKRQKMQMIETQKQIESMAKMNDDHKATETILEN